MDSTTTAGRTTAERHPPGRAGGPVPSGALLTAATTVCAGLSALSLWWTVPTVIAAFLAGRRPGRTGPTALVLVAALAAGVVAVTTVPGRPEFGDWFVGVVAFGATLPWFAGRFWRQWQDLTQAGWERAEQLEREQRLVAEQARSRERARIAQDMHDVLGHDLSLIALSAGALKLAPGLDERHRTVAGDIRTRAAAAVERLGEVIGVLREETEGDPEVRGTGIARLAEEAAASGLAVELCVDGEPAEVPAMVGRAAFRVVQEALTNIAKHAPEATATVRVTHSAGETTVVVENGPSPSAPKSPVRRGSSGREAGRGLIGLDERVRLAGGTFEYGPRDGGFSVGARIPHVPPPRRPPPSTSTSAPPSLSPSPSPSPQEHRAARRRVSRTLVAAVMLPLVTAALLSGALARWEAYSASRSVLDPGDYARLRVGLDRSEVGTFLPDRETNQRPPGADPEERGTTCEYYAMTADRFDDRSGDVYRLCFRDGTLVSLDALAP
ncbi:sensor histidine kinase [Streptomyces sp. NPDC051217]|uniref:sensor histidine kinase n=1 Tax=Streptomyces sp. NPDC051217 TaxID=3365644 RepID=UPI0037A7F221